MGTDIAQIEAMQARGYTRAEIAKKTGSTVGRINHALRLKSEESMSELEVTARRFLWHVPTWWKGSTEDWKKCVRANFCDVLKDQSATS